jgi:hypothetical protein
MKCFCPHGRRWFAYCEECARSDPANFVPVDALVDAIHPHTVSIKLEYESGYKWTMDEHGIITYARN